MEHRERLADSTGVSARARKILSRRSGVSEYWFVDPEVDVVRVYRAVDAFERARELSREAGDVLTTPLLPGLELPLALIFKA